MNDYCSIWHFSTRNPRGILFHRIVENNQYKPHCVLRRSTLEENASALSLSTWKEAIMLRIRRPWCGFRIRCIQNTEKSFNYRFKQCTIVVTTRHFKTAILLCNLRMMIPSCFEGRHLQTSRLQMHVFSLDLWKWNIIFTQPLWQTRRKIYPIYALVTRYAFCSFVAYFLLWFFPYGGYGGLKQLQSLYFMDAFSNPMVGNSLAYPSTLWRRASISDWKFPIVALKSFSFVPAMNDS